MTKRPYHSHALRSMFRRFGILSGDRSIGYRCLICQKDIKTTNHYFFQHNEYYKRACEVIDNRSYNLIEIEA